MPNFYISEANLSIFNLSILQISITNPFKSMIGASGTDVTLLGMPKLVTLAAESHNKIYRFMMCGRTT
jgi:hypothetical protein